MALVVKFCKNSNQLVSVGADGNLKLWNIGHDSSPRSLKEPTYVRRLAYAVNGNRLVATAESYLSSVWNIPTGKRIDTPGPELLRASLSEDGSIIASVREQEVLLHSADSGELLHTCRGHTDSVWRCQIAPSGALVASGDGEYLDDPQNPLADAILWDAKSGRLLHRLPGHHQRVQSLAFSPDEGKLATLDGQGILRLWNAATGALLRTSRAMQSGGKIDHLTFDRAGESLYAASPDAVLVVDATTGTIRRTLAAGAPNIYNIRLSPDGKTIALTRRPSVMNDTGEGVAELWDLASGELKTTLARDHGGPLSVAFSPDGRTLATGHRDGTIAFWQAATDEEVRRQAPP
jgi:WD40 repeat protein